MKKKSENHRSPKFPFISLGKAISYLSVLIELDKTGQLSRETLINELGFESFSGPAARTIGALRAYHLIERSPAGPQITEIGKRLASDPTDSEALHIAALSPIIFRKIWRSHREDSKEQLIELLSANNFTEEGANKAVEIYSTNSKFAQLDQLTIEPELPERRPRFKRESDLLFKLPLKNGALHIHGQIESEEFDLIIETLQKWRNQIS